MGLAHVDPPRAQAEIRSLLSGQWKNGMIPHIIFNREAKTYYPGPEWWDIGLCEDAPDTTLTSGITQPPVLAWAAYHIYLNSQSRSAALHFLGAIYDQLAESYLFFRTNRMVDDSGLVCIIHPWESGLDNAPIWDSALERIPAEPDTEISRMDVTLILDQERPTDLDYQRYTSLVRLFKRYKYSQVRILQECPFLIQSVIFNSLLSRDLEAMIKIGEILGRNDDQITNWYERINSNFDERFLDPATGLYQDYDCRTGTSIHKDTFSEFIPIITSIPASETLDRLIAYITSPETFWPAAGFPIPTVALGSEDFDPVRYWRGPVWININWLVIQGLLRHGYRKQALGLMEKTIEIVQQNGFFEYFHPLTGEGHGSDNFSWTAALIIDLILEYSDRLKD
ncbi:MAG: glycoside hydrolase [Candidatus Marinimicrobia bacterium]|nr:glycoside hydrolase [Candidatus Neomarinimicrobiota bacterium]